MGSTRPRLGSARPRRNTGARTVQLLGSARDPLALLDHLGVQRAVLGGMSQGGFVSLRAVLLAPDRVRGLILIDTTAGQEDPAVAPAYEQMQEIWRGQGPGPVQEVVSSIILGLGSGTTGTPSGLRPISSKDDKVWPACKSLARCAEIPHTSSTHA